MIKKYLKISSRKNIRNWYHILKPVTIAKNPLKVFSLKEYYLNSDKIFGIKAKDARWYHASRPEDLVEIEIDILAYGNI